MKSTLITEDNAHLFIEGMPENIRDSADLLLGVIDEETDTACGVLAAAADDDNSFQITFIYVAEKFRNKGAGKELIETLKEVASENRSSEISCIHTKTVISDGVYELLEECGFVPFDLASVATYEVRITNIDIPDKEAFALLIPVSELTKTQWESLSDNVLKLEKNDQDGSVLPLRSIKEYDQKHSFACFSEDGKICGALLVSERSGEVSLDGLYTFGRNPEKTRQNLIAAAKEAAIEDFGQGCVVLMYPYTAEQFQEMDRICAGRAVKREETVVQILEL